MKELTEVYKAVGAAGFIIIIFAVSYIYLLKQNTSLKNIVENNNSAFESIADSNNNVAHAIELLGKNVESQCKILCKVDQRSEEIAQDVKIIKLDRKDD